MSKEITRRRKYYEKRIYETNSQSYSENSVDLVSQEFFAGINLCDISDLVDFLSSAAKTNANKFLDEDLEKLLTRINQLSAGVISPKNAGIILNSLAKLGYESADLEGLNIKNLTKNLNGDLSSKELLETILETVGKTL